MIYQYQYQEDHHYWAKTGPEILTLLITNATFGKYFR
jgi:hypothetical protein